MRSGLTNSSCKGVVLTLLTKHPSRECNCQIPFAAVFQNTKHKDQAGPTLQRTDANDVQEEQQARIGRFVHFNEEIEQDESGDDERSNSVKKHPFGLRNANPGL